MKERHTKELSQLEKTLNKPDQQETGPTLPTQDQDTLLQEQSQDKKPTRKQKRQAAKQQADNERREQIEEEIKRAGPDKKTLEQHALRTKLYSLHLNFKPVRPDGNCLFTAVVNQLPLLGRENEYTMTSLREATADYILKQKDDFIPFLETDDVGFEKYCNEMKTTPKWGGHCELQAISHLLHLPIDIYSADAPTISIGEEYAENSNTPIRLSYHKFEYTLGEHYNSVVSLVQEEEDDA